MPWTSDSLGPYDGVALEATGNTWAIATLLASRAGLDRIGHHHPTRAAGQQCRDRPGVPGSLQCHLIRRAEVRSERADSLRCGREPAGLTHHPVLPDRDLREIAVHIQPYEPPCRPLTHRRFPLSIKGRTPMLEVRWAKRHLRIRARSATGQVAGAAI